MRKTPAQQLEFNITTLLAEQQRFASSRLAPNTISSYEYDWKMFEKWCAQTQLQPLPADAQTITLYVVSELLHGLTTKTLRRRLCSIRHRHITAGHDSPALADPIGMLQAARRMRAEVPDQVLPLTVDLVRGMSVKLRELGTDRDLRDRAAIITGMASGLRSANLAMLMMADVEPYGEHLVLQIRKEKQDKESKGRMIGLPRGQHPDTCPVRVLNDWLDVRGRGAGPVFLRFDNRSKSIALDPQRFCFMVKRALNLIGVDPLRYGSHSLRAGLVTEAGEHGAGELAIAAQTGHKDMKVLRRYFRRQNLFRNNVAAMIGL